MTVNTWESYLYYFVNYLMTSLSEAKKEVMEGFADDFDTKRALDSIMRLVHAGNVTFSQPSNVSIGYILALNFNFWICHKQKIQRFSLFAWCRSPYK